MNISVEMMGLEQVAKIYSGVGQKSPKTAFGYGGCPWVMVEDLQNNIVEKTSRQLTEEGMRSARISPPDTVFFSSTGTIGKVGIATKSMAPSNNIIAVEFDSNKVYPLYGMYCLAALRDEFAAEARGAVYDSLRLTTFRQFQIPVPNIEYQKIIANKLKTIHESIVLQKSAIKDMKCAVYATFENYFGQAIELVLKQKIDWRLKDFVDILLNGAPKKTHHDNKDEFCYISTPMLDDWEIQCGQAPIAELDSSNSGRFLLQANDIVMNRINSMERLGRCGLIVDEPQNLSVFGQNTMRLRANGHIHPFFLFVWLTHPFLKRYIQDNCKNSTSFQSTLNKQVVLDIPLPQADMKNQRAFAVEFEKYLNHNRVANQIIMKLQGLQDIWYGKIRLLQNKEVISDLATETAYREKQYWITPSGINCYYDNYLECIQVPIHDNATILVSQLPQGVDIQFLDSIRNVHDSTYGSLGHVRLHRIDSHTTNVIQMQPVEYRSDREDQESKVDQKLEDNDMISEQQDFGYVRHIEKYEYHGDQQITQILNKPHTFYEKAYNRFEKLPEKVRGFVKQFSPFQQAVYEEFLLTLQPLACHMVRKQIMIRSEQSLFSEYTIQDVNATIQLLENTGLIERRQGLNLNYYDVYSQGEERRLILDHREKPISIDTWIWAMPKGW